MNPVSHNPGVNSALSNDIAASNKLYERAVHYAKAERTLPKARDLYNQSADKGNRDAMNKLGLMCQYALGGDIDLKKAAEMYNKAIRLGHPDAHLNLICMNAAMTIVFGEYKSPDIYDGI